MLVQSRFSTVALLFLTIFALSMSGPFVEAAWAQSCMRSCDGLPGIPQPIPPQRSFDDFIVLAYNAVGRTPSCLARNAEYFNLADAAASNQLLAEAQRFVATLFMTQASYDVKDLDTYRQTDTYQARNPQELNDRAHLESFVTDLYRTYLQRSPDQAGLCHWTNDICSLNRRKKGPVAFEVSPEFGDLVEGLYDTGPGCVFEPDPCINCGPGLTPGPES